MRLLILKSPNKEQKNLSQNLKKFKNPMLPNINKAPKVELKKFGIVANI